MKLRKVLSLVTAGVVAASLAVSASAESAGLVYQTNAWTFRNTIAQSNAIWWNTDGDAEDYDTWNVSDVEITQDGTYTVSFEKNIMEDCKDGPEAMWNFLKLQTNIASADYPDLAITIDSLKIDGKEIEAGKTAVLGTEDFKPDEFADENTSFTNVTEAYVVGFYNKWNEDQTVISSEDFGGKVEVTFTVTGFKAAGGADPAPADPTPDGAGDGKEPANTGVEGVAVVAGLAVLATGAVVIAKKRK